MTIREAVWRAHVRIPVGQPLCIVWAYAEELLGAPISPVQFWLAMHPSDIGRAYA